MSGIDLQNLPEKLPVFPLEGVILLPQGNLPLNIFEPRYLDMVRDARKGAGMIGMIQPRDPGEPPELMRVGCAAVLNHLEETDDGRLIISLAGICRFELAGEMKVDTAYRQVRPNFGPYFTDLRPGRVNESWRAPLLTAMRSYFERCEIEAQWDEILRTDLSGLVSSLAMICPFAPLEKQALLEAENGNIRTELMIALMQMASHDVPSNVSRH